MRHHPIKRLATQDNLLGSLAVELLLATSFGIKMVFTRLARQNLPVAGDLESLGK